MIDKHHSCQDTTNHIYDKTYTYPNMAISSPNMDLDTITRIDQNHVVSDTLLLHKIKHCRHYQEVPCLQTSKKKFLAYKNGYEDHKIRHCRHYQEVPCLQNGYKDLTLQTLSRRSLLTNLDPTAATYPRSSVCCKDHKTMISKPS